MSAAKVPSTKATTNDAPSSTTPAVTPAKPQDAPVEEDDEFEDFPVEDWADEDTEMAGADAAAATQHLWEESWDDDDTQEDFAKVLKEELAKVEGKK